MLYFAIMALTVWLLGMTPPKYGLRQNNYKNYLILAGLVIVLITGLRSPYTGTGDNVSYINSFDILSTYSSFSRYYDLWLSGKDFLVAESGFYFFTWILARIFDNGQILLVATMAVTTYAVCRFIHINSDDPPTSLLIYVCLGLLTFNMNGMRQAMAMSVCLFAYEYAKKQKLIPFVLIVLLAMQFHKSAICFLPVFILPAFKEGKGNIFFFMCLMSVFLLNVENFIGAFNDMTGKNYELQDESTGGGITVVMIYAVAVLLPIFVKNSLKNREIRTAYCAVLLGFVCYISRYFTNQILERVSYYFVYFVILLIPMLISRLDPKERNIIKYIFSGCCILLLVYRIMSGAFADYTLFFLD